MPIALDVPLRLLCLALVLGTAGHVDAQAQGSGQLTGRSALAVRGCGRDRADLVLSVVLRGDGTWTAEDQEGALFNGTHAPGGSSGRRFELQFDDGSAAAFVAVVVADVAALCELGPITVTSVERKTFVLKLNRRQTAGKLALVYRVSGTSGSQGGTARYRVKAKGPWQL